MLLLLISFFVFYIDIYPGRVYNFFDVTVRRIVMTKESDRCKGLVHRSDDVKHDYVKRLNRIEGQVRGISKMICEDRYCGDIMVQISAVNNAMKSLGQEMLLNHMKTCMVDDIKNKKYETIDEVMDLCRRMMK